MFFGMQDELDGLTVEVLVDRILQSLHIMARFDLLPSIVVCSLGAFMKDCIHKRLTVIPPPSAERIDRLASLSFKSNFTDHHTRFPLYLLFI